MNPPLIIIIIPISMNIEKYLNQLVEDIECLLRATPPYLLHEIPEDIGEQPGRFKDHVLNNNGVWIADYSGIRTEQLPREDLLTDGQVQVLLNSLMMLMEHYNFHLVFPDALPDRERYIKVYHEWHKFKAPLARYDSYYEFCHYVQEECPFPEYCDNCSEIDEDIEGMMGNEE